ncbi:hypothetical protein MMYC01_202153 [Madurella mycetomatis]|uniref:Uncharacterized protein n=1 Tax=Madurella mycetomatis TaxID=100816 RepID=A0A175WBY3_9PEZI|nr:hypothetical protein MMYC01_202153 [Madurella mycetomatis]
METVSVAHLLDNVGMLNIINKPLLGYVHSGSSLRPIDDDFPLFLETIFHLAIATNLAREADTVAQGHTATSNTPLNFAVVDSVVEDGGAAGLNGNIARSASPTEAVSDENYGVTRVLTSTFTDIKDNTSVGDSANQILTTGKHLSLSATMNMPVDGNPDKAETACAVTEPSSVHQSEEISPESISEEDNLEIAHTGNTDDLILEDVTAIEALAVADDWGKVTLTVENEEPVADFSAMMPVQDISFEENRNGEVVALASEKFAETVTGDLGAAGISSTENATSKNGPESDELLTTTSSGAVDDEQTNNVGLVSIVASHFAAVSEDDFGIAASSIFDADFERFLEVDDAWSVPQLHEAGKAERDIVRERLVNRSTSQFKLQKLLLERASRALSLEVTAPAEVVRRTADIASRVQGPRTIDASISPTTPKAHSDGREAIVRLETASAADPMRSRSVSSSSKNSKASAEPIFDDATCPGTPATDYCATKTAVDVEGEAAAEKTDFQTADLAPAADLAKLKKTEHIKQENIGGEDIEAENHVSDILFAVLPDGIVSWYWPDTNALQLLTETEYEQYQVLRLDEAAADDEKIKSTASSDFILDPEETFPDTEHLFNSETVHYGDQVSISYLDPESIQRRISIEDSGWGQVSVIDTDGHMGLRNEIEIRSHASYGRLAHCNWMRWSTREKVNVGLGLEIKLTTDDGAEYWLEDVCQYTYEYDTDGEGEYWGPPPLEHMYNDDDGVDGTLKQKEWEIDFDAQATCMDVETVVQVAVPNPEVAEENCCKAVVETSEPVATQAPIGLGSDHTPLWMTDPTYVSNGRWEDLEDEYGEFLQASTGSSIDRTPLWMAEPTYVFNGRWEDLEDEYEEYLQYPKRRGLLENL